MDRALGSAHVQTADLPAHTRGVLPLEVTRRHRIRHAIRDPATARDDAARRTVPPHDRAPCSAALSCSPRPRCMHDHASASRFERDNHANGRPTPPPHQQPSADLGFRQAGGSFCVGTQPRDRTRRDSSHARPCELRIARERPACAAPTACCLPSTSTLASTRASAHITPSEPRGNFCIESRSQSVLQ